MPKPPRRLHTDASYHEALVEAVEIGPDRDIELRVDISPVFNRGGGVRRLRFSRIQNFDEVSAALQRMKAANGTRHLDEIHALLQPEKGVIGIAFARLGYLEVHGATFRER